MQSTTKSPRCARCDAGKEPAPSRVGCLNCQGGSASQNGLKCVKCTGAKQPNKAKSACVPCPENHYFSITKLVCLACAASKAPSENPRVQGCVCAAGFYNSTRLRLRCIEDNFQGAAQCAAGLAKIKFVVGGGCPCGAQYTGDGSGTCRAGFTVWFRRILVASTCVLFESRRLVHSTNKPGPRPPRRTQMMTAHCVRVASVVRPRAEHLRLSQAMLDSPPIPQLTNHPCLHCSQRTYAKSASSNAITGSPVWAAIRVSRVPPRQRKNARRASVESCTGLRCLGSKT